MKLHSIIDSYTDLSIFEIGREECRSDKDVVNAAKPYHLFHYIFKGKGTVEVKGKVYNLSKGSIFYIPKDYRARYYPNEDDPWSYEWIGFEGNKVDNIIKSLNLSDENPVLINVNHDIKNYFDEIYQVYRNKGFINIKCLGMFYELLSDLMDNNDCDETYGQSSKTTLVQLAKEFINNNYQFNIKVTDVANNVDTTPNYLSNCFVAIEHMSTKYYITKIRMETAAKLLEDDSKKINEIAKLVGYKNQLHFSEEFKKFYGVSPLNYKKETKYE